MKLHLLLPLFVLLLSQACTSAATLRYVDAASLNPLPPYTSWAGAASSIQQAVDAASSGDTILVTNGVYSQGGLSLDGSLSNRVAVTKSITLQSVNGPAATLIQGSLDPAATNGPGAVRCVYLTNGAALIGFTLTNGATHTLAASQSDSGGGLYSPGLTAVVSNCVLIGNYAFQHGGGASGGRLENCLILSNWSGSLGGGIHNSILTNCVVTGNRAARAGGGVYNFGTNYLPLFSCLLSYNSSGDTSGGALGALHNCLVLSNTASIGGGGLGVLTNCTLVGNAAAQGGGTYEGQLHNCIVFYNYAPSGSNHIYSSFSDSCTSPLPDSGLNNFTNPPLFIDQTAGNFRLQSNSPCIDTGNLYLSFEAFDLDGRPRHHGDTVDIGAYEFQAPGLGEFIFWLQQYALPTNGSADYSDSDSDGMNNWQEWICGTNPTNSDSVLKMLPPLVTPLETTLRWQSVTNRTYSLERAPTLAQPPSFDVLATNIPGQPAFTTFTIANPGPPLFFYRIRVEP